MSFTYGFYNSVNHDRVYDNEQLSSIFNGIMLDGIFKRCRINGSLNNNDCFKVTPAGKMKISVGRGMAWLNNTWNRNDDKLTLVIDESHQIYSRYDAIIIEINGAIDKRKNAIKILKGSPSSSPTKPYITRTGGHLYQYALAYILVRPKSTEIVVSDIQNVVGTTETPYASSIADDVISRTQNNLDIGEEEIGYILDARQGKVLDDKITESRSFIDEHIVSSINMASSRLNDTSYAANTAKNTIQNTLPEEINKSEANVNAIETKVTDNATNISTINSTFTEVNTHINSNLKTNGVPFHFHINTSNGYYKGSYGYLINNIFHPFISNNTSDVIVNLSADPYKMGNKKTTLDISSYFPDLYNLFTVKNFYYNIKEIKISGSYVENKEMTIDGGELAYDINMLSPNPSFLKDELITYNKNTGILTITPLTDSKNLYYKLWKGGLDWQVDTEIDQNFTLNFDIDYDVYLIARILEDADS